MQTDKNHMKLEQSVSMHSHALERPCKRQIVTDPKTVVCVLRCPWRNDCPQTLRKYDFLVALHISAKKHPN